MKRIIFFKGKLETLDYFVDKLCIGARELGIEYYICDVNDEESYLGEEFCRFIQKGSCVALLLNQIGLNLMDGDRSFWLTHNITVYDFVQDHPYNYDIDMEKNYPNVKYIVLDRDHADFIRKYYNSSNEIIFIPNGGWEITDAKDYFDRE